MTRVTADIGLERIGRQFCFVALESAGFSTVGLDYRLAPRRRETSRDEFQLFLPQMRLTTGDLVGRAEAAEAAGFGGAWR